MVRQLTPAEAADALASPMPPRLLDVRTQTEHRLARIRGAHYIPMDQLPKRIEELDPHEPIIVMCHHGLRSMQVALWLRARGFTAVDNLAGGIERWSREVDPSVPRY
ncbi:MAG: hypothetical protein KC620_12405 [Myxococcales bacterium]|nr:hypothetical protein [Myxococcales bacterium]